MDSEVNTKEKIRVSVKLIKQLSTTFYPKTRMIFDELVSNSRDAMSTEVHIETSKDEIVIRDDGEGMTHRELVKFFYISHTDKLESPIKMRGDMKRYIIGRFGIGKLSLYQICNIFRIETVKDGTMSWTDFDFSELESKDFIDELDLNVHSAPADKGTPSGTTIRLFGLNTRRSRGYNSTALRRALGRSIRPDPTFAIYVDGVKVKSDKLVGSVHEIGEEEGRIPGVGTVTGKIFYTTDPLKKDEAGVFVRVFGRVVNENPRLIDFSSLRSPKALSRRTLVDVDADFLADAVMTNRNGFVEDDDKYKKFLDWLRTTLNRHNADEVVEYKKRMQKEESESLIDGVSPIIRRARKRMGLLEDYDIKVMPIGSYEPECVIENARKAIVINSHHPMYLKAREDMCLVYHVIKAVIVQIALEKSRDLEDFRRNYEKLVSTI